MVPCLIHKVLLSLEERVNIGYSKDVMENG